MKTKFIFIFFLVFATSLWANSTDNLVFSSFYEKNDFKESGSFQLIKDIQLDLEKGFYSLVIEKTNQLEKQYPNSKFNQLANRCKVEALYFLGRKQEAKILLKKIDFHGDSEYFKGRLFFDEQKYFEAVKYFYESAKFFENSSILNERYFSCLYYSAKAFNLLGEYKKSLPILLSLVEKQGYSSYQGEVFFLLCQSFFEQKDFLKVCSLYEKTSEIHSYINEKYFRKILLMAASSYDSVDDSEKAQSLYTKIAQDYEVEGLGISEFWVKSGIESFNDNDFSDALRCFEVAKSTENLTDDLQDIILMYQAQIKAKTENYSEAIKFLENNSVKNQKYFYSLMCVFSSQAKDYQKSISYGEKLLQENFELSTEEEQVLFWYAFSLFKTNQNEKAIQIVNKISESTLESQTLKAKIQFENDTQNSPSEFAKIYEKNQKSQDAFENFVIANLSFGKTDFLTKANTSKNLSLLENSELKNYFLGLANYLEGNWNECINFMDEHLKVSKTKQDFAKYYKAYSLFMLQENKSSYELFMEAQKTLPEKAKFQSLIFASQCALAMYNQNSEDKNLWLENAISSGELACKVSVDESKKLDCLILLSQLYSLNSDYEKAVSLIEPYSTKKDETSLKCLYVLASLHKQAGNIQKADEVYETLANRWPQTEIAQESLFMQGQLFYENNKWGDASDKFSSYRKTYPNGKFYLQSCFYNGMALKNLGNDSLAILLLEESANSNKQNELSFISLVELMNLYRQKGDYENAVKTGTSLLKNYPEQAKEKNIKKTIEEISYLASGESEKTAGFMTTFINEGRMTTLAGRKAGFEVAKSYISVPSTKEEGAKLLQEFISVAEKSSSKNEEIENLASAYYLIGTYYREKLDYKKASSNFLLSAQYYASFEKEFSARALYGAIESFDCNSSFADSKQTYFTLKEKYPQSHWTQRAYSVVSEYLE